MQNLRKLKRRKKNAVVLTHEQSAVKDLCDISKAEPLEQPPTEADLFLLHASTELSAVPTTHHRRRPNRSTPSPDVKRARIETAPTAFSEYLPMASIRMQLNQSSQSCERQKCKTSGYFSRKRLSHSENKEDRAAGLRVFSNPLINPTVAPPSKKRERQLWDL